MKQTFLLVAFLMCLISLSANANADTPTHITLMQGKCKHEPAWLMKGSYKSSFKFNRQAIALYLNKNGSINYFEIRLNTNELMTDKFRS